MDKLHPVQLEENIHARLKIYSKKSGVKIRFLVEAAITDYLNRMRFTEMENKNG